MTSVSRFLLVALLLLVLVTACKKPYRVGEHVLVEWEEGNPQLYPAYIVERVGETRYRVHFDGYDSRFDQDVSLDRIHGRTQGPASAPPPPKHIAQAVGIQTEKDAGAALAVNPYKAGDRVRVRWRGSIYSATVLEVTAKDRVLVRYEGHESAWDEVVPLDRIAGRK